MSSTPAAAPAATPDATPGPAQEIPAPVRTFLLNLQSAVKANDGEALRRLYELDFNTLTETYYREGRWPTPEVVTVFYQASGRHSNVVVALYGELFWRHVCARFSSEVTWFDRVYSANNYSLLFEYFQKDGSEVSLPLTWQWDIVDEVVYQYQESQRFRLSTWEELLAHTDLLDHMRKTSAAWRAPAVTQILRNLASKASVAQAMASGQLSSARADQLPVRVTLGYFARISLVRLLVSIGNYHGALTAASPIQLSPSQLYWRVPAAHVTLVYNLSFAYLMCRRYDDAGRIIVQLLSYLAHSQSYLQTAGYQQEPMQRTVERMYYLLYCCEALLPPSAAHSRSDEAVANHLRFLSDKLGRLETEDALAEAFLKGCPKIVDPVVLTHQPEQVQLLGKLDVDEAAQRQLALFRSAAATQTSALDVHSIARMYNNLSLEKLAQLMGFTGEGAASAARSEVLAVRSRAVQTVWRPGMPLSGGERCSLSADLDVFMDIDTIYVTNLVTERNYVEQFTKQIMKGSSSGGNSAGGRILHHRHQVEEAT